MNVCLVIHQVDQKTVADGISSALVCSCEFAIGVNSQWWGRFGRFDGFSNLSNIDSVDFLIQSSFSV